MLPGSPLVSRKGRFRSRAAWKFPLNPLDSNREGQCSLTMRLAEFITSKMEQILVEWEAFARSLFPTEPPISNLALRDHAQQILEAVAKDLEEPQTDLEQMEKSKGRAAFVPAEAASPAKTHAVLRAKSGFDINQMAAEYRALRASVLRLWKDAGAVEPESLPDVIRFNEAIDQAITESITAFSEEVDAGRNLVFGMVSHDMRNPLGAIVLSARYLLESDEASAGAEMAQSILNSADALKALLDNLMDFSQYQFGVGMELNARDLDLTLILADELKLHNVAFPNCRVETDTQGDLRGCWDGRQLQRIFRNLLSNASSYGTKGESIRLALTGDEEEVRITVANTGPGIEPAAQRDIFEPFKRGTAGRHANRTGSGLGLFIVREIAHAHGGEVELRSDTQETVFTVHLPRAKK